MTELINTIASSWCDWVIGSSWQLAILVVIVAVLVKLLGNASPRLRYGLWLLVLIKVFLPPSLSLPTGIGSWGLAKVVAPHAESFATLSDSLVSKPIGTESASVQDLANEVVPIRPSPASVLMIIWAGGAILFWIFIVLRYRKVSNTIRSAASIDEGPLRVAMERSALSVGIDRSPDLFVTETLTSPFLFGVFHPCVVLPSRLVEEASDSDISAVLTHELVHLLRRDIWTGWLQVVAQGLFWFHPLVWWASREIRHYREEACDDSVLRVARIAPERYGETMVRVLTSSKARSLVDAGFLGIFERGTKLQTRLEQIMNYEPNKRRFGVVSKVALGAIAAVLLPMSTGIPTTLRAQDAAKSAPAPESVARDSKSKAKSYPRILRTIPEVGATEVATSVRELRVIFDQDMSEGMSWTGGGPEFPPVDKSRKAKWVNKRTCVLPVKLQRGHYYRVGINSKSFQNFRSAEGVATPPSAIYFATVGASSDVVAKARTPEITRLVPANGATDVDPNIQWIKVTFNMPMGGGMSWTGSGPQFPEVRDGKKPVWSKDKLSCAFPVKLKPGHKYMLGLNSRSHNNFQSAAGVPLSPVVYEFQTK